MNNFDLELQAGGEALGRGDLTSAHEHVSTALRLRPNDPLARNMRALLLFERGRYGDAGDICEQLTRSADHASLLFNAGVSRLFAGDVPRAAAHFRRALELNPGHQRALCFLAVTYLAQGQVPRARSALSDLGFEDLAAKAQDGVGLELAAEVEQRCESLRSPTMDGFVEIYPRGHWAAGDGEHGGSLRHTSPAHPAVGSRMRQTVESLIAQADDRAVFSSEGAGLTGPVAPVTVRPTTQRGTISSEVVGPEALDGFDAAWKRMERASLVDDGDDIDDPEDADTAGLVRNGQGDSDDTQMFATDRAAVPSQEISHPSGETASSPRDCVEHLAELRLSSEVVEVVADGHRLVVGGAAIIRRDLLLLRSGPLKLEKVMRTDDAEQPLIVGGQPLVRCSGGTQMLEASGKSRFELLRLAQEKVCLLETAIAACSTELALTSTCLGQDLRMISLSGSGYLALHVDAALWRLAVDVQHPVTLARRHLVGWTGEINGVCNDDDGGELVECTGAGVVMIRLQSASGGGSAGRA